MATEIRRLIFSHAESTAALTSYGKKVDLKFPQGKIIRARFAGSAEYEFHSMKQVKFPIEGDYNVKDSARAVTLTFFDEKTLEQKYYNVTADFISSALIEYCIANKIMLPKAAEKRLEMTEFNICLDIGMENKTEQTEALQELRLED